MTPPPAWAASLDMIEAIAAHEPTADVVLRIAGLVHTGRLDTFAQVVLNDRDLDEATRAWVLELTSDETVLLAAGLYLERARQLN